SECNHYRRGHKLPDKNDAADALALAAYLWENHDKPEFFLHFVPGIPQKLREIYLQLQSFNRIQSPIINRLRQQLAFEFPEVAKVRTTPNKSGIAPLWGWLAQEEITKSAQTRYDRKWEKSLANRYGGIISYFSRQLAMLLCFIHVSEKHLEKDLQRYLNRPEIKDYVDILDEFGMGDRTQALIISQIYPISRFDSLPQFKKRLGCAGEENSSGDKVGFQTGAGSKLCRSAIYLWILTSIAPKKSRPLTKQCQFLGEYYDELFDKFYRSDEETRKRVVAKELVRINNQINQVLHGQVKPLLKKQEAIRIEEQLDMMSKILLMNISDTLGEKISKGIKESEVKKGFGNLIIMKTAGLACKMLFKELKRRCTSIESANQE
ncbi:MAG: IS110 family transposase, partial [Symploca sp. SIO3E6]|nr:IS110 family transposase [Caldora sp. SIO3E6]